MRPQPLRSTPTVSVVVPCYNYGRYLPALVQGLLDQPQVVVDVLVVDDASPDGSGEVAEELAARHPSVSVLRHPVNRGHIRTYNDGLEQVRGDYVALLSADDLLPPGALTRAVALMEAHPSVGLVYGYARSFSGEAPAPAATVRNWTVWSGSSWLRSSARQARCFISSPEVVMRRAALDQVGLYDPRLPHSGDLDLWLRTALHWDVGRVNGPDQALYRVHEANMHLTTYNGWLTDLVERRTTFGLLFDEHATGRAEVAALRPVVMRRLAVEALRRGLRTHRDGGDAEAVADYRRFALETDAGIGRTVWGRAFDLGPGRGGRWPAASSRRFASRVTHHLAWRRERRYGI
ncbi:glycosyltransferase [Microlunatus capsulatus]